MIERGDFLEWAEVHGNLYGTSRKVVEELRAAGRDVILTIDVQGADQARKLFSDAISVFVLPPSRDTLLRRLDTRGANSSEDLQTRLKNALYELAQYKNFDYIVINDDLNRFQTELKRHGEQIRELAENQTRFQYELQLRLPPSRRRCRDRCRPDDPARRQ